MILPSEIIIGNLYLHDNKWTVAKVIQSVPYSEADMRPDMIVVEIMGDRTTLPLDEFCKKFNEINVPELRE